MLTKKNKLCFDTYDLCYTFGLYVHNIPTEKTNTNEGQYKRNVHTELDRQRQTEFTPVK